MNFKVFVALLSPFHLVSSSSSYTHIHCYNDQLRLHPLVELIEQDIAFKDWDIKYYLNIKVLLMNIFCEMKMLQGRLCHGI